MLKRYAIINTTTNLVDNVIEYEDTPANPPPGFGDTFIAVEATANIGDGWNGLAVVPKIIPPSPLTHDMVDVYRDQRLATGFVDPTTGKTWQCDEQSRGFWTSIGASAGLSLTTVPQPSFTLIAADNSQLSLSASDTFALLNLRLMAWVSDTVLYARSIKNAIAAGNPPADYTQGWP